MKWISSFHLIPKYHQKINVLLVDTEDAYSFSGMDLPVFKSAKDGDVDFLGQQREQLRHMLTTTKNKVLHTYITCATSTNLKQAQISANIAEKMVEMCPPLMLQPNRNGDTALHIAAIHEHTTIIERLIQSVAAKFKEEEEEAWPKLIMIRTTNKEKDTSIHEVVRFNPSNVVEILTTHDPNFYYPANVIGETLLYLAAERGYSNLVSKILNTCKNSSYQGLNGRMALHAAVIWNGQEITRKILEKKWELTKKVDEDICTLLHLAASIGHASIVKQLLEYDRSGLYVREKHHKRTALHFAI